MIVIIMMLIVMIITMITDQVRVLRSSLDNLTKERDKLRSDLQVIVGWDGGGGDGDHDDGSEENDANGGVGINSFNNMLKLMTVS